MYSKYIMTTYSKNLTNVNSPFILSIEGNIGSGKSTLLRHLNSVSSLKNNKPKWIFLQEPVEDWENIRDKEGTTMLQKFYNNQEKYAFSFQIMAYISRLAKLKKAVDENPGAIIVTERSLLTDKHVFAKMLYDSEKIEEVNYQIYQKWFDTFVNDYPISGFVYVNTEPTVCCERVNKRSRNGEDTISIEYLKSCHEYHSQMMDIQNDVLTIQGNKEFEDEKHNWTLKIIDWTEKKYTLFHNISSNNETKNYDYFSDIPLL